MKAIMNCPFIPIAARPQSHRGAQGVIYADMLKQTGVDIEINWGGKIEDHNEFDEMYVYHGSDWTGGLNFFGGVKGFPYVENTRNFSQFKGKVYSVGIEFPAYHKMIEERIDRAKETGGAILDAWHDVDLNNLKRMHDTAEFIKYPKLTDKIVIGDSHAICMYRPDWVVNSVPFKTLNGALNTGFKEFIEDAAPINTFNKVELYFGNIDIRHHLCRIEGNHIDNAKELASRYIQAAENLPIDDVSIYELLPIEDESRKLPKSGYYKGKPFWGTWEQRNSARIAFYETLKEKAKRVKIIKWTDYLLNRNGQLDFKNMEMPHSIHLSRSSYPHWTGEEKPNTLEDFFT